MTRSEKLGKIRSLKESGDIVDADVCVCPSGWFDWLSFLLERRLHASKRVVIAILTDDLPPKISNHIALYADGILIGADAVFSAAEDQLVERKKDIEAIIEHLPNFVLRCKRASAHSVLWIDPNIHNSSPAMKALVGIAPDLVNECNWHLKLWCHQTSIDPSVARINSLRSIGGRILCLYVFPYQVTLRQTLWFLIRGDRPAAIVHTSVPGFWKADICSIHFLNFHFCRVLLGPLRSIGSVPRLLLAIVSTINEFVYHRIGKPRLFLTVGDRIAEALQKFAGKSAHVQVLPSCYDEVEFSPSRRALHRIPMRAQLSLQEDWFVLAFASQGDYRRKGFFLLAKAMDTLWERGETNFRVLLLGGNRRTLDALTANLEKTCEHWRSWLVITGWVDSLSAAMSAADSFVFPSYFESFAAVEAEACGLGLPLALSDHWGSEMVLHPSENGIVLPMVPNGIAEGLIHLRENTANFTFIPPKATPFSEFLPRLDRIYKSVFQSASSR